MTEPGMIRCDQFIARPPEAVWQALTDPELHARWWAAGDVRAEVGHRFTLDMGPWGQQRCRVIAVEPGRLLRYSFEGGGLDSPLGRAGGSVRVPPGPRGPTWWSARSPPRCPRAPRRRR